VCCLLGALAGRMALRLPWWWWAAAVLVLAVAVEAGGGNGDEGDGKALMAVKAGFGNAANALVDWDGRDHCAWRGVACDSASFAVVGLCVSSLGAGVL
jgi:LRR receptor-like serine/threonine-protein kinase ERECTA